MSEKLSEERFMQQVVEISRLQYWLVYRVHNSCRSSCSTGRQLGSRYWNSDKQRREPGEAHRHHLAEKEEDVSRGSGRCQRRVVELLKGSPERRLNRLELDEVLVEAEGFDPSNVLRAIKGLARHRQVIFQDGHRKETSVVRLPSEAERVSESMLFEVLAQIGSGK